MSPISDVRSPGGWLGLFNARVARWLVVGALTTTLGGGAAAFYGTLQGAQASFVCEARLVATSAKGVTSYSCLNPLPNDMTGAVLGMPSNIIVTGKTTASPVTKLNICTTTSSTAACSGNAAGTNVASGILLTGNRILALSATGTTLVPTLTSSGGSTYNANWPVRNSLRNGTPFAVLAPRNYGSTANKYLNFTFQSGSGQLASGAAPAFVRVEVVPCNLSGVGC